MLGLQAGGDFPLFIFTNTSLDSRYSNNCELVTRNSFFYPYLYETDVIVCVAVAAIDGVCKA